MTAGPRRGTPPSAAPGASWRPERARAVSQVPGSRKMPYSAAGPEVLAGVTPELEVP